MSDTENYAATAFGPALPEGGLYIGTALRQRIDLIEHLVEFGHQMILLQGESGSGKTSLLDSLIAESNGRWQSVTVRGGPALSASALLSQVAEALGLAADPVTDDASLVDGLRQRAVQLERAGKLLVLLVDDADQLPPDTVALLLGLARHQEANAEARVVMTADQEHSTLLDSLQRDDPQRSLVHVIEIPPLTEAQVEAFLAQRARALGLSVEECLDPEALALITRDAGGNPGKVLALARQAVTGQLTASPAKWSAALTRLGAPGSGSRKALALGVLALGAVVLTAAIWLGRPVEAPPPGTEDAATAPAEGDAKADAGESGPGATADDAGRKRIEISLPDGANGAASGAVPPEGVPAPTDAPVAPAPGATSATVTDAVATVATAAAVTAAAIPAESVPPTRDQGTSSTATPLPEAPSKPEDAAPKPKPAPVKSAEVATPPKKKAAKPATEVHPSRTAGTVKPDAKPEPKRDTQSRQAAKPREPQREAAKPAPKPEAKGYTVQLMGVRDRAAASQFIAKHDLGSDARIVTSQKDGRPWFTVAYGSYPTRAAAETAATRLPAAVKRATTPWVRAVNGTSKTRK